MKNQPVHKPGVGQPVAVAVGDTLDHSVEAKSTEVIGHPSLCEVSWLDSEQMGEIAAEVAIREADREHLL